MWGSYEYYEDQIHILPVDEYEQHIFDNMCGCGISKEIHENGIDIIVHSSFDGREAVERAFAILNNK